MKIKDNVYLYFLAFIILIIVFIQLSVAFSSKKTVVGSLDRVNIGTKQSESEIRNPDLTEDESENSNGTSENDDSIILTTPKEGSLIESPLTIIGRARGNWFFEGVLPINIVDSNGKILASFTAKTLEDWMTTDYVEFSGQASFVPTTDNGKIIFEKDNPSDLPENGGVYEVSVRFK